MTHREKERGVIRESSCLVLLAEALRVLITVALSITYYELNAHLSVCEIIN